MIELYGVFYKLITTNYYNCLCCQLPDKSLISIASYPHSIAVKVSENKIHTLFIGFEYQLKNDKLILIDDS